MSFQLVVGESEVLSVSGLNVSFKPANVVVSVLCWDYVLSYNSSRGYYYISGGGNSVVTTGETAYRDSEGEKATKETWTATENGYEGDGPATLVSSFLLGDAITDVELIRGENNQLSLSNTHENITMILQSQE